MVKIKQISVGNPNRVLQSDAAGVVAEIPKHRIITGSGQTVGAATAVLASVPLVNGYSYAVKGWVVGRESTSGDSLAGRRSSMAKRVGGTSSVLGAGEGALASDASVSLADADFVLGTNTADLQATGAVGTTINWWCEVEYIEFAP